MERELKPADIILQQLGGRNRLKAMIGASDFYSEDEGRTLQFKFKLCKEANLIKIKLDPMDTYTVEFHKIGRMTKDYRKPCVLVHTFEDVYNDNLKEVISDFTGLALSIGKVFVGNRCIGGGS